MIYKSLLLSLLFYKDYYTERNKNLYRILQRRLHQLHFLLHFRIQDAGINLCRGNLRMSQHFTDTLHTHSFTQSNSRCERMARQVESDRLCKEKRTGEDKT